MAQALEFTEIKSSCNNLTSLAGNVEGTCDVLDSAVSKIESPAWEGKASTNFRDKIKSLVENLPDAKQQLALSVLFLASCADAYEELGSESVKKLKDLVGGQDYIDNYDVAAAPEVDLNARYGQDTTTSTEDTYTNTDPDTSATPQSSGCSSSGGGCSSSGGGCGSGGGSRYSYTVGDGSTSQDGVTTGTITSAEETTSSLTDLTETDMTGKEIEIPDTVSQGGYTVTGYDYWITSGEEMKWADGTNQQKVAEIWKQQGSVFKNGIAVINVDGKDRYLVAVSTKFGNPGDCIDVKLSDGTTIPCIIGDSKGSDAGSEWGHVLDDGKINVLEFEVQREKYLQSGNPTTEKWNLPWDSTKDVSTIKNTGSIIGAKTTDKTVVTSNSDSTGSGSTDSGTSDSESSDSGSSNA